MNKTSNLLDLLLELYKLKEIKRRGWIVKSKIKDAESVASHTFGMLLIAILFFNNFELVKKILIHDIAEIKIGDLLPEEKNEETRKLERKIIKEFINNFPEKIKEEFYKSINNLDEKIVKEIDRLDMAIQALYYKNKGFSRELLEEFITSADKEISNELLREIFNEVKRRFYI